jgi:hypothetical protein
MAKSGPDEVLSTGCCWCELLFVRLLLVFKRFWSSRGRLVGEVKAVVEVKGRKAKSREGRDPCVVVRRNRSCLARHGGTCSNEQKDGS